LSVPSVGVRGDRLDGRVGVSARERMSRSVQGKAGRFADCVRRMAVTLVVCAAVAATAAAQEGARPESTPHRHVVSANPFGLILMPWYNGEYERQLGEGVSLALSGSRLSIWDDGSGFYSANGVFRYYPNGRMFRGFYLGPRIGLFWVSEGQEIEHRSQEEERGPHLGFGFELGYAWLLGAERHLSVSIGAGATRVLNRGAIPVLRFINVGWAY